MKKRSLAGLIAIAGLSAISHTAFAEGDSPWLVRARAVSLDWDNGQKDSLQTNVGSKVEAKNRWIPEIDVSYFFTKNIATELVLTYPQNVDIKIGGVKQGTIKALPPSLILQYHFTDLGAIKPYVGVGVNYTSFTKRNNILSGGASVGSSSTGGGVQAGLDYALNKSWSLNFDVKYIQMKTDVMVGGNKKGVLDLSPITIGLGAGYRF